MVDPDTDPDENRGLLQTPRTTDRYPNHNLPPLRNADSFLGSHAFRATVRSLCHSTIIVYIKFMKI